MTDIGPVRNREDMRHLDVENVHGGSGWLHLYELFGEGVDDSPFLFMHDDILEPGAVIGEHLHNDAEIYFVIEGTGTILFDGKEYPIQTGGVSVVTKGHTHGILNAPDAEMHLMVLGAKS